ncbi:type VI secretion system-associated protein VasI [Marinobacter halophilus]|uniref:Type VI secretion system-associated protein TagO n=1 Tax=Marinobacter halophilus TaxID=1323740 RepID=A0A2T1KHP0_9GAMM|nr:type VI secretion system-associated protein VasI [Marinobacter halophilus]PSF09661.1 type VI secretion system-associated protein TagO [Marinobacter halophilus]GGC65232.1 type VI secretion-associated protein [Marinobacter halophilus]
MTLKDRTRRQLFGLALLAASGPGLADLRLSEAETCTEEPNRLERLACFDSVFATPLARYESSQRQPQVNQTERWRRAFAQAGGEDASGVIYRNTGAAAGHLVTISALGVQPPRPVLALQCHNNITELTVMLPEPMERERVDVTLGAERAHWRVRDEGLVVSAGRGLPAIRIVQGIVRQQDVRLNASAPELDGLLFDLTGYAEAIQPLRQACGW